MRTLSLLRIFRELHSLEHALQQSRSSIQACTSTHGGTGGGGVGGGVFSSGSITVKSVIMGFLAVEDHTRSPEDLKSSTGGWREGWFDTGACVPSAGRGVTSLIPSICRIEGGSHTPEQCQKRTPPLTSPAEIPQPPPATPPPTSSHPLTANDPPANHLCSPLS